MLHRYIKKERGKKERGKEGERKEERKRNEEGQNKIEGQKGRKAGKKEKRTLEPYLFQRNILESEKELLVKLKLREGYLIVYDFDLCIL